MAFAAGQPIPRRYSCAGEDLSPPLAWRAVPAGAVSLALIVDDPDAPVGTFTHWLAWGINPDDGGPGEGEPARREGRNDFRDDRLPGTVSAAWPWAAPILLSPLRARARARGVPRARAAGSSNAHSRTTSSPSPSLSAPISDESADFPRGCVESLRSRAQPQPRTAPRTPPAGRPRRELCGPRLLRRLLDNHRLSLHGGVPARQARDLSAGSDVVGRLAGADELPAAKRRPGKASFRDLLQDDPHGSSLMRNLAVIHGSPTLDRGWPSRSASRWPPTR